MAVKKILRHGRYATGFLFATIVLTSSQAQTTSELLPGAAALQVPKLDGLAGGVVLNRTITIVGHDFYQYFTAAWRTRDNNERYSIAIIERPTAVRGSEIWVEYRNKRIFRIFLSPRRAAIKDISQRAVDIVYESIVERDLQQLLYQDHDLAKEELQ